MTELEFLKEVVIELYKKVRTLEGDFFKGKVKAYSVVLTLIESIRGTEDDPKKSCFNCKFSAEDGRCLADTSQVHANLTVKKKGCRFFKPRYSEKAIVICKQCGNKLVNDYDFCNKCGNKLDKSTYIKSYNCPFCKERIPEEHLKQLRDTNNVYCQACGKRISKKQIDEFCKLSDIWR